MRKILLAVLAAISLAGGEAVCAQESTPLPSAPAPQTSVAPQPASAGTPLKLTVKDAESLALKNNPAISIARLNALISHEAVRETRSALLPAATVSLTGVDANEGSRIGAGGLNNPVLYDRAAAGSTLSQLITDFGRSTNLLASSRLHAKAEDENAIATAQQISLAADQAFYTALESYAVLKVADQTVASRQLAADRIQALTKAKLKSDLDLSFANVNLSEAKLLQLEERNNYNAALASLSSILGFPNVQNLELIEEGTNGEPPPASVDSLIQSALKQRPDLNSLQYSLESAQKFRNAEHELVRPTISALGTVGSVPFNTGHLESWYGAVGVNISIPVFNGFLFNARAHEADLRAEAADRRRVDLANRISRDVRIAWLDSTRAYHRLDVTRQLLDQARMAQDLAQTRYNLGLGSIVEYSQAELQATQAEIANTTARYEYAFALKRLQFETGNR